MSTDIIINIVSSSVGVLLGAFLYMGIDCLFHKKNAPSEPIALSTQDKVDFIKKVLNSKKLKLNADISMIEQLVGNIIVFENKKLAVFFEWDELRSGNTMRVFCSVHDKTSKSVLSNTITEFIVDEDDVMPLLNGTIQDIKCYIKEKHEKAKEAVHQSIKNRERGDLGKIQKISKKI